MKILVLDAERAGLPFALICQHAGHDVRLFQPSDADGTPSRVGEGMVPKVREWVPHMRWADLIVMTDNTKYTAQLAGFFAKGFPIFGTTKEAGELELDRQIGQRVLERGGVEVLPCHEFTSYDDAITFVKANDKMFVSKPWGGATDKNLSYVPSCRADLVCRLQRWKKEGLKGSFVLQERIDGYEMGVGAWFGPGGFSNIIEENWEHKKLMNDNHGPTTGEMGTVMRYVTQSRLFDEVLKPMEEVLHARKFVGSAEVNCMVDKKGQPWPLEFTCRMGWPAFNLSLSMHTGDPANWMADLLEGRDTLTAKKGICVGVVVATGDFPFGRDKHELLDGWPIRGLDESTEGHVWLTSAMMGKAPIEKNGTVVEAETIVTSGNYIAVVTGDGPTVEAARKDCYDVANRISIPIHKTMRTDIGCRLEKCLPPLQKFGYAKGMKYA